MSVAIERNTSRLAMSTLRIMDSIEFWERPEIPELPYSESDIIHQVESTDRIDILAKRYYKREKLWWVIAHANNFKELPVELVPGDRIRIPDPYYVRKFLL